MVLSFGIENIFDGRCLLVDSNIPTGQKLNTSLALATAIVISLMSQYKSTTDSSTSNKSAAPVLPFSSDKIIDRIISKISKIKDDNSFNVNAAKFSLLSYFNCKPGCVFSSTLDPNSGKQNYSCKEILSNPSLIYMETIAGASKSKEQVQKLKMLLEYRLFLRVLQIDNFKNLPHLMEIMKVKNFSNEDMVRVLEDNFDNKRYLKKDIEETMGISLVNLVPDFPYAAQLLDSIFSLNPYEYSKCC